MKSGMKNNFVTLPRCCYVHFKRITYSVTIFSNVNVKHHNDIVINNIRLFVWPEMLSNNRLISKWFVYRITLIIYKKIYARYYRSKYLKNKIDRARSNTS